uniref:Uncharacterized protein n=1 Tax=Amphimedon queenslandica TaxID=400682 RepID=A0A1X7T9I7_AMPQE
MGLYQMHIHANELLLHGISGQDEGHLHKRELIERQAPPPGVVSPGIPGQDEGHLYKKELIERQSPPGEADPAKVVPKKSGE